MLKHIIIILLSLFIMYKTYKYINKKNKNKEIIIFIISTINIIVYPIYAYKDINGDYKKINYKTNVFKPLNINILIEKIKEYKIKD